MAYIGFNDGSGYASLRGVFAGANTRFRNFSPRTVPVGVAVSSLETGRRSFWRHRTDHLVDIELPFISARVYDGESGLARANRLAVHLLRGGLVDLAVEDDSSTPIVVGCWLADGATASVALEDRVAMFYTFSATLANNTTPFFATYGGFRP